MSNYRIQIESRCVTSHATALSITWSLLLCLTWALSVIDGVIMLALVASFYRQRLIKQRTLWQLDKVPLIFDWQDQQYKSVLRSSRISEYFLIINVKDAVSGAQQGHLVFCWQTDQRQYRRLSAHILACQRILPKQLKG